MRLPLHACALLMGAMLPGCSSPPEPPVAAAQEFLAAVDDSDCDRAWTYLSAAAQAYVQARAAELQSEESSTYMRWTPEHIYCRPTRFHDFGLFQADTAALKSLSGPEAVVSVARLEPDPESFLIPGFWATRYKRFQEDMHMVDEGGSWKLVLP